MTDASKAPEPKTTKKPAPKFLRVLGLLLRGRFADATELDIDGDTEN